MTVDEKELALALEHPRGTERRRLLPYRGALNDIAVYAALPAADRDVIVHWCEVRRLVRDAHGLDNDAANLSDPLLPYERLREHILGGERRAAGRPDFADPGGDLEAVVIALRRA